MYSLIVLGCVSFAFSLLLTPFIRDLFRRWNLVDYPDATRKRHEQPVPRVGGIAIALSYILAFVVLAFVRRSVDLVQGPLHIFLPLIPSALLIFWVGLIDDLIGLKPWQKLSGQVIAATGAYIAGIEVQSVGGHIVANWWSFPLTVFWLIFATNAINLIDGVDGLAAGVSLVATLTMVVAAVMQDNLFLALATVPLVGCLLGFLRYNFNPATIFLGDSGSLLVGFLLGCYGVLWSEKSATILGMTAPLIALSVPLLDAALAVVRRFLTRKPIFAADRGHIHHRLLDQGFTPRRVVLVFYGLCSIAAVFSLIMSSQHFERLVIFVVCAMASVGIARLGYVEFRVAGRMFRQGAFRRHLSSHIVLEHYEHKLNAASTAHERWSVIQEACQELGFQRARLSIRGENFEYLQNKLAADTCWHIHIPLSKADYVDLWRPFGSKVHLDCIAPLADILRQTMGSPQTASTTVKPRYQVASRS